MALSAQQRPNRVPFLIQSLESRRLFAAWYVSPIGSNVTGDGTSLKPWQTIQRAANTVNPGDVVNVLAGTYTEQVSLSRSGTASAPIVFQAIGGDVIVTSPSVAMWTGVINIRASHVRFDGLDVRDSAWYGYNVEGASGTNRATNVVVTNAHTVRTYASGIYSKLSTQVSFSNNRVQDACISPVATHNTQECITVADVDGFEIAENEVWNSTGVSAPSNGGEGIDAKASSRNGVIRDNVVRDLFRLGIYLDSGSKQGTGPNDDVPMTNIRVMGNKVWNCGSGIIIASELGGTVSDVRIINNLVYSNRENGISVAGYLANGPRNNILIANNTVYRNGFGNSSATWGGGIDIATTNYTNIRILNNIAANNESWQIGRTASASVPAGQLTASGNLSFGSSLSYWNPIIGTPGLNQDPQFANAAAGDFRLRATSPAINFGSAAEAPTVDLLGNPRIGLPDVGAYEYFNAAPTILTSAAAGAVVNNSVALNVVAADDDGAEWLTYSWLATTVPAGAALPTFSVNGTNAAASTTAMFAHAGSYVLRVNVTDVAGNSTPSDVQVNVVATLSGLVVIPGSVSIATNGTKQFTAAGIDQFGQPMPSGPVFWTVTGSGNSISATGLLAASSTPGPFIVTASGGGFSAVANGMVTDLTSPVLLSVGSRKVHGNSGAFTLPLALSGPPSIEPRYGGANTLVFSLSEEIRAVDGVLDGNEVDISNATLVTASINGAVLTITLGKVANGRFSTVTLKNVTDLSGNALVGTASVTVGNLYGDVNRDGIVSAADESAVRNSFFKPVSATSFLFDIDASGFITVADQRAIRSLLGTVLQG